MFFFSVCSSLNDKLKREKSSGLHTPDQHMCLGLLLRLRKIRKSVIFNKIELTLRKRQTKIAADDILYFYFYLSKKIRLGVSSESSA